MSVFLAIHLNILLVSQLLRFVLAQRLGSHISKNHQIQVAHSMWMSHLRYGLQLFSTVRTCKEDQETDIMTSLQKAQNTMLRIVTNKKIKDRIRISVMLEELKMLSVNQMAAQIKLTEMWKATHIAEYPIKVERRRDKIVEKTQEAQLEGTLNIQAYHPHLIKVSWYLVLNCGTKPQLQ